MRQFMGLVRAVLTLGACIAPCWGQSSSITVGSSDGLTPPALEPGTPSGSYALSDFDTVNLFNGKLSVAVPLVRVGAQSARTEAGYTMTWVADRSWNVSENQYCAPDQHGDTRCYWGTEVNDGGWSWQAAPGLSPGTMWARSSGDTLNFCFFPVTNSTYYYADNTSTRLTFTRPDGTETEFVDTASHGQPQRHDYACGPGAWAGQNRGRTFVATDGSGARFTSMQDIVDVGPGFANSDYPVCGRLQFADGTTYTFGHPETCSDTTFTDNGLATSILDRNGNLFSFLYDSQRRLYQATDPLGRQTSISYASVIPSENTWIKITDPSNRVTTLNFESLENVLRSGYSVQTPEQLFPTLTPPFTLIHYELFLSSIIYPNNSTMTFRYNPYGEVARIGLPTGGAFEYDWDGTLVQLPSESPDMTGFMVYRRVQERRVYNTGDILEQVQRYAASETCSSAGIQPGYPQQCSTTVIVSYKNGQNADLGSETHTYSGSASCGPYPNCSVNGTPPQEVQWLKFFTPWKTGRENQTVFADTSGGSLKTEQAQWQQRGCTEGGCWFSDVNSDIAPAHDARMIQTVTSLGSATSSQVYCYDGNNNRTDVYEYDYGYSGGMVSYCQPPSGWVRRTHTDFNTTYAALNMLRLPSSQQVSTPQGTVSRTQYSYDDYGELPLTPYSSPAQHDSTFGASYTSRGNLTKVSKWLDTTSEYLADKTKYDILGNVVARTNPKSYSTTYSFNGMCGYGFPTSISNALNHTASLVYDCGLGKATQFTDANGVVTKYTYEPGLLGRLKQVDRGYSKPERITSVYNYNDTAGSVAVETSVDVQTSGDGQNVSTVFYDGLGRESESRQNVDTNTCSSGGYVSVQRQYDGRGRLWKVSNPACGSNPQDWTVTAYDGLGRPTDITAPGAAVTHTDYGGAVATTRDPANTTRAVTTDALGRITRVVENGTYTTSYSYNVLDNLTCVSQSGQYRVFDYDSLGRLTSADNPETRVQAINSCSPGSPAARPTVKFTYDTAGNLLTRTDSAGSVTSYAPDALDRVVSKTTAEGTVQFTFDQNLAITEENDTNYPIGRLTGVSFGTLGSTYRYDALGRYQSSQQTVDALPAFIFHYDWVPAGLAAMKYPSGRVVSTSYDSAGRPSGVTGYASAVQYAPHGVLSGMTFANGLSERWTFNRRTQPGCLVALVGSTAVLKLTNSFSSSGADPCNAGTSPGSDNNGNVRAQSVVVGTTTFTQSYGYDGLNRISTAVEANGGLGWTQGFGYDAWGNRSETSSLGASVWAPPGYSSASNRISGTGWSYANGSGNSGAGNLTGTPFATMTYDAEGRLKTFQSGALAANVAYGYDGEGRRVKATVNGSEVVYVYDAMGELAAEYGAEATGTGASYLTVDHLGSTRLVTGADGAVLERHDYLPFGEEIPAQSCGQPVGQRSPRCDIVGYGASDVRLKFTGKERDTETGLDFFGARYFAGAQGRFTSPDPKVLTSHLTDPQSWNRYAYTRNSPLTLIDPDGKDFAQAWNDFKTFVSTTYAKASVGVGVEIKITVGAIEAKAGIAAKANLNAVNPKVGLSTSVDIGFSFGQTNGAKTGESISADRSLVSFNTETMEVAGPAKATGEVTDTLGIIGGNVNSKSNKIGLGYTTGKLAIAGGEIGATKEGLRALGDAFTELKQTIFPEPPPPPPPPTPNCNGQPCSAPLK